MANRLLTACHSRTARFHSVEVALSAKSISPPPCCWENRRGFGRRGGFSGSAPPWRWRCKPPCAPAGGKSRNGTTSFQARRQLGAAARSRAARSFCANSVSARTVRYLVCEAGSRHWRTNLSPNMTANWLFASVHSRSGAELRTVAEKTTLIASGKPFAPSGAWQAIAQQSAERGGHAGCPEHLSVFGGHRLPAAAIAVIGLLAPARGCPFSTRLAKMHLHLGRQRIP